MTQVTLQVKQSTNETLVVSNAAVTIDVDPNATRISLTSTGIKLIADNTDVTAVIGDDVLIEGSIDGTNYFQVGAAGAALNHQMDVEDVAGTPSIIVGACIKLRLTPSQILATEDVTFNVTTTIGS